MLSPASRFPAALPHGRQVRRFNHSNSERPRSLDLEMKHPHEQDGRLSAWLPVMIGLALITLSSSDTFSAQHTSGPLRWMFEHLFGPVSNGRWNMIHHYIVSVQPVPIDSGRVCREVSTYFLVDT